MKGYQVITTMPDGTTYYGAIYASEASAVLNAALQRDIHGRDTKIIEVDFPD